MKSPYFYICWCILIGCISLSLIGQCIGIPYLWGITAVAILIMFILQPFYFLVSFLAALPFSYLTSAGPDTSILKPIGTVLIVCALPAILLSKTTLKPKISPLGASIILFILGCFFSLFSFLYSNAAIWGFIFFLGNVLFYGICVNLINSIHKIKWVIGLMLATFSVNAVIGILQKTVLRVSFRALGTVQEPNYFALILLPFIPIALFQFWNAEKWWLKILFGISAVSFILVIPLTLSRSGLIVLVLMLLIVFVRNKKFKQLFLVMGAAVAFFFLVLPQEALVGLKWGELTSNLRMMSIDFRFSLLLSGLRMFFDHPLLGIGVDNFINHFYHYSSLPPFFIRFSAHNTYLEILTGTGIVGFVAYGAIIFFALKNYITAYRVFKLRRDNKNAAFVSGVGFGFLAFLLGIFFLTAQHHILFWFFVALSSVFVNCTRIDNGQETG